MAGPSGPTVPLDDLRIGGRGDGSLTTAGVGPTLVKVGAEAADDVPLEVQPYVRFGLLEDLLNKARANSLWPLTFGLACCAIEMMAAGASRFDLDRFGAGVFRPSARQADVMIFAGTISKKMAPVIKQLWDQMPAPKWAIAMGGCTIDGGPFKYPNQYAIVEGADLLVPVDVYIPGCPPRPEALIAGILALGDKIKAGRRFKG
ncbi:MAG: NADH-quinone oxidoreductase subunit B [Deltaproteobacteria bacterium HGW-Deltaproteobacteria-14]|nr:MAG: NADH-quinone oxidoreductase subunit B [Deltaproteobacteria bacterium HGW-Deltaproteobacteria-14]